MKELTKVAEITVSYKPKICSKMAISSSQDAYEQVRKFYTNRLISLQEQFIVMYLNKANDILGVYRMSVGGISCTVADIKLILGTALKTASSAFILSHNHPSGSLKPSPDDIRLTQRIKEACRLMDLKLFDHLIIAPDDQFYSMANNSII